MPGAPQRRAQTNKAKLNGEVTTPDAAATVDEHPPEKPKGRHGASRERMLELVEIRRRKAASGEIKLGRARTKFTNREITERVLEELEPIALKVLRQQLHSKDERVRQAAAVKVLEYRRGKPTQAIKASIDTRITAIRFETAALAGAPDFTDMIELEAVEEEDDAVEADS